MKYADTDTLLTIVESADVAGRIHILCASDERVSNQAQARELLESVFMDHSWVTLRLECVKKAITELDISIDRHRDNPVVSLNLAKLLQLPAVNPSAELAEFRNMLEEMKAFYLARPTQKCGIQICNERDRNRKVYGSITCLIPDQELLQGCYPDQAATQALTARIDASPALSHWLRHTALTLQKIGPWSWITLREDTFFGPGQGPYGQHRRAALAKLKPPADEQKYRVLEIDF